MELKKGSLNEPDVYDLLCQVLLELRQRVAELEVVTEPKLPKDLREVSEERLAGMAASICRARQARSDLFGVTLFADPAWDMLLDLFVQKVAGKRISTTSLCVAARVPQTTALRYITLLEQQGLIKRYRPPEDQRLIITEITTNGYIKMKSALFEFCRYSTSIWK